MFEDFLWKFLIDFAFSHIDTLKNEANLTKAAKGKRFTSDYDLLCYQIIFQLAFKRDNQYFLSHIVCETDLINEREYFIRTREKKVYVFL